MEYIKKFLLKHIGYALVFLVFFFSYNIVAAIFMTTATLVVGETIKELVSQKLSHPIFIGMVGSLYLYCLYIFKTKEIHHEFFWTTISFPFSGLMLVLTLISGAFFASLVKHYVLLK